METEERKTEKTEMEKGKPKCIRKKKIETQSEKYLYNDVCLYSRPTHWSSVVYLLLKANAFVNSICLPL